MSKSEAITFSARLPLIDADESKSLLALPWVRVSSKLAYASNHVLPRYRLGGDLVLKVPRGWQLVAVSWGGAMQTDWHATADGLRVPLVDPDPFPGAHYPERDRNGTLTGRRAFAEPLDREVRVLVLLFSRRGAWW